MNPLQTGPNVRLELDDRLHAANLVAYGAISGLTGSAEHDDL